MPLSYGDVSIRAASSTGSHTVYLQHLAQLIMETLSVFSFHNLAFF